GFLRKSTTSLPAQNALPAPCQSTTRTASSLSASLRMSARSVYMPDVIAFFWAGRLSWTRRNAPVRSVIISLMVCSFSPYPLSDRVFPGFRHRAARAQAVDGLRGKSQVTQDLFRVLAEIGSAPGRDFGDPVHLNRTADRPAEVAAGAFERNDNVICRQLRIVD